MQLLGRKRGQRTKACAYKAQHAESRSLVQQGLVLNMLQERHTALQTDTLMGLGRVWDELRVSGRAGGWVVEPIEILCLMGRGCVSNLNHVLSLT